MKTSPRKQPRVVVIGGGFSGLNTARFLRRKGSARISGGIEVLTFEASNEPGGKARTRRERGWTVELGPNGYLDSAPRTVEVVGELGLKDRILPASKETSRRYLWKRGALRPIPLSPPAFFRSDLLTLRGRLRVLTEPWARRRTIDDETVAEFAKRRLGTEAANTLVGPMVLGVFGGDFEKTSLRSAFPKMREMEDAYGSLIKAMFKKKRANRSSGGGPAGPSGVLTSFKDGITELVQALAQELGDTLICGRPARSLSRASDRSSFTLIFEGESSPVEADSVVLATESFAAAKLVASFDKTLSNILTEIPYAPMAIIALGYKATSLPRQPDGFGFLVQRGESLRILGCLWDSTVFPGRAPRGRVLLRAMVGGAGDPEAVDLDDDDLIRLVRDDLATSLGITDPPEETFLTRWPHAIPQYEVGHMERLERIEERLRHHPGLFLTGNAYRGVALNCCVREAESTAEAVVRRLEQVE